MALSYPRKKNCNQALRARGRQLQLPSCAFQFSSAPMLTPYCLFKFV